MTHSRDGSRDRIDELAESFVARFRLGERPSIDDYAQKYPELADELRQLLPALVMLEQHGAPENDGNQAGLTAGTPRQALREIGEFTIVREIGRGGMGIVYEAVQQSLGRHVALKVLSSPGLLNPTHLERFRLEARSAGRLHHSHIVPVFGVGEHEGLHYYAMQFIPGQSLDQVIDALREIRHPSGLAQKRERCESTDLTQSLTEGLLTAQFQSPDAADGDESAASQTKDSLSDATPSVARELSGARPKASSDFSAGGSGRRFYESIGRVGLQVAEALAYAHAEGILHRDIKPSNLLLDAKGNIWVTDFGLVKADESQALTETGDLVGTLRYMAPERLDGWSDPRSDIYGLGATLYELITLRTFLGDGSRAQLLDSIRFAQPPAPTKIDAAVPRDLETIVLKALAKEPPGRYQTADEMAEDLRRFLADRPILARRSTARERLVRWCRRNPAMASLIATVALALTVGTLASTWQAVRATRAENLAQERLTAETHARKIADDARASEAAQRKMAEAQRAEAEKQRAAAEANFQKAEAAVEKYFTLVSQSTLFDVPGLEPLRMQLMESALRFYQDFAAERSNDPRVMADVAVTQMRVAQINASLDRNDEAIAAIRQALEVIERLRREHPNDHENQRRLAGFSTDRRWAHAGTVAPHNPLSAFQTLLRFETLWEKLAAENSETVAFQADLIAVNVSIGALLHWTGRIKDATKFFQKATDIGESLVAKYPAAPEYRSALADVILFFSMSKLANGEAEQSTSLSRRAVQLGEDLVKEFPEVPAYRLGLSSALVALADRTAREQPQQAEVYYRRAYDLASSMADEFPGYVLYLEKLSTATLQLAIFEHGRGNFELAEASLERLQTELQSPAALGKKDPTTRHRIADLCLMMGMRLPEVANQFAFKDRYFQLGLILYGGLADEFPENSSYAGQAGHCHQELGWIALRWCQLDIAMDHHQRAVKCFEKVLADKPKDPEYLGHLGSAYRSISYTLTRKGRFTEACPSAATAVRVDPDNWSNQIRLLEALRDVDAADRSQEALALLTPLADSRASDAPGWARRGYVRAAFGRLDEAASDFAQQIELSEDAFWWSAARKFACREICQWPDVFDKVAVLRPEESALWIARGQHRAICSQWNDSAQDYAKVIYKRPLSDECFEYAALLCLLDDRAAYQEFCRDMAAKTAEPQGVDAFQLARICAIGPAEGIEGSRMVEWAHRGVNDHFPWTLIVLAMAEYRAEQFDSAIAHHHESLRLPRGGDLKARNYLGLAACHYRLGQMATAYRFLEQARELVKRDQPVSPRLPVLYYAPAEWIALHATLREVEALFAAPPRTTTEQRKGI